ncbi:phage tail terminator-like protein [Leptothrix discophora]|uniref:Phage tail terminator-like protein n=1 Tax=Leptothrix discophora TaxID=89 RepID=A0ABT9G0T9_LEPDI|nr:phage tail terminator-like protein [Leptothrix discophora]MDP4299927.1 phage tail terminator-like protein [Leptothrix discophora]
MSYAAIYQSIEATVKTALGTTPLQLPNTFINTQGVAVFARITHLPAAAFAATLGTTGQNSRPGLSQVDVFVRAGTGSTALPDTIVSAFGRSTQYTYADGSVYELLAYRDVGSAVEDGYWQERVVIQWKAITNN